MAKKTAALCLCFFAVIGAPNATQASPIDIYTDEAAFNAAIIGATTYGFTGIAPDTSYSYFPSGITVGPATFTDTGAIFVSGAHGLIYGGNSNATGYGVPFLSAQTTNVRADSGHVEA